MKETTKQNIKDWILSFQHLISAFGATVLVPLLVGIDPNVAILTAGIVLHL